MYYVNFLGVAPGTKLGRPASANPLEWMGQY